MFDKTTASDKKYLLGVIGDARSLASFWQMAKDRVDEDLLGSMGVLAAALPEADVPPKKLDMGIGIPVYAGFREMLYMHPEINLVIETTGDPKLLKTIRKTLPPTVTLVERAAASFFINLLTSNKACTACKIDLMQTQSLLTTVLDQLKEDILFLDAEGVILNANQTLCNKLNMEKRQLIGHHFSDFFTNVGPTEDKDGVKHKCS
ncbi:MAG: PAS domain-containing protein, partial [Proteobacteria bacterium]|nr:PAS domain-containing protein [Pseudomonadota bacterium]